MDTLVDEAAGIVLLVSYVRTVKYRRYEFRREIIEFENVRERLRTCMAPLSARLRQL